LPICGMLLQSQRAAMTKGLNNQCRGHPQMTRWRKKRKQSTL
jgi:hypothetical protein